MSQILFYRLTKDDLICPRKEVSQCYQTTVWHPTLPQLTPKGVSLVPFAAYWAFHHFRLFANRDFCYFLTYDGPRLIHYCAAYPRFFRFPFMATQDMQIGSVWTDPAYRGQGLAQEGVGQLTRYISQPNRNIWYVVDRENLTSVRLAERLGFHYFGRGEKTKFLGQRLLGSYQVIDRAKPLYPQNQAAA